MSLPSLKKGTRSFRLPKSTKLCCHLKPLWASGYIHIVSFMWNQLPSKLFKITERHYFTGNLWHFFLYVWLLVQFHLNQQRWIRVLFMGQLLVSLAWCLFSVSFSALGNAANVSGVDSVLIHLKKKKKKEFKIISQEFWWYSPTAIRWPFVRYY